jgi:hypothetical protein
LDLRDLPTPHEVLVGLGRAPLMTRALPTGVRIELIVLAPDHQPKRIVVPADAEWRSEDGKRMLSLSAQLEPGAMTRWPDAEAGEVGGVGQPGFIGFEASPSEAELWLVVAAGDANNSRITVPCNETAHLLVVDPSNPSQQRRVAVEPELLRAAADKGSAELSLRP